MRSPVPVEEARRPHAIRRKLSDMQHTDNTRVRRRRVPRTSDGFDPRRPFTVEEAGAAGISPKALRSRTYRSVIRSVHVLADVPDSPGLVGAALLAIAPPRAWVSHASAGRILGLPLPALPGEHVSVVDARERIRRAGVRCHVGAASARVHVAGDLVYSAPVQVFVELAEQLTLVDLVVVGDWMVRKGMVTLDRLRAFVGESRLRGASAARVAVAFVRERVDSPMETRLRMLFVLAGFPEPDVNLTVDAGNGRRRYDLCWPGVKVIAEYDGRHHAEREEQWEADLERREQIDDDEWRIRVFVARDIYNTPDRTLDRMAFLLRAKRLPGMPRRLKDDWRAHFPVKDGYL